MNRMGIGPAVLFTLAGILVVGCPSAAPNQSPPPATNPPATTAATQPPQTLRATNGPSRKPNPSPTEGDSYLGGTITWQANATKVDVGTEPQIQSVTGTADVVLHAIDPYLILAEREGGSTYRYDYSNNYGCSGSHEEGTLESQVGVGTTDFWDFSIATLNPGGPLGEDLHLQILMPDYCGPSLGADAGHPPEFNGFPDCEPGGDQLYARFNGVDSYVIDCDGVYGFGGVDANVGTVGGHVSGTLSPISPP